MNSADGIETRIRRMVTNLMTLESIGLGQFVRIREIRVYPYFDL
jgi:hypothetical protein